MTTRTTTLGNGRKVWQEYIGNDPTLADSERPENWATVELDAQGDPYRYRVSQDIQVGFSATGGFLISIAGVIFGIPDEQLGDIAALITTARKDAKARKKAYEAEVASAGSAPA